jgi:hypothetical protein
MCSSFKGRRDTAGLSFFCFLSTACLVYPLLPEESLKETFLSLSSLYRKDGERGKKLYFISFLALIALLGCWELHTCSTLKKQISFQSKSTLEMML